MNKKIITTLCTITLLAVSSYYFLTQEKFILCSNGDNSPRIFSWDRNYIYSFNELKINSLGETYKISQKNKKEIKGARLKRDGFDFGALTGDLILIDRIEGDVSTGSDYKSIKENYMYHYYDCVRKNKSSLITKPKF